MARMEIIDIGKKILEAIGASDGVAASKLILDLQGVALDLSEENARLRESLRSDFALSAADGSGRVLGIAGMKTARGGLVAGGFRELARAYGWPGALWRGPLLELTERPLGPGEMLAVDLVNGVMLDNEDIHDLLKTRAPYKKWLKQGVRYLDSELIDTHMAAEPFDEPTLFRAGHVIEQAAGRFTPTGRWWMEG